MCSGKGDGVLPRRVSPFGYSRIIASVQLPVTFRRLHVLLRQLVPSHSPRTLCSFTIYFELSLGAFYARFIQQYATFKMLFALRDRLYLSTSGKRELYQANPRMSRVGQEKVRRAPFPHLPPCGEAAPMAMIGSTAPPSAKKGGGSISRDPACFRTGETIFSDSYRGLSYRLRGRCCQPRVRSHCL